MGGEGRVVMIEETGGGAIADRLGDGGIDIQLADGRGAAWCWRC